MLKVLEVQEATEELYAVASNLMMQLTNNNELTYQKFQEIIDADTSVLLFLKINNCFIGMTTLTYYQTLSGIKGWIEDVIVDEKFRGKGYSVKLLEEAIVFARNKGVEKLMLTSRPTRVAANNLYRKIGFSQRETNVYIMDLNV